MKKIVFAFLLLVAACNNTGESLDKNKIYFFYSNGCPHCHDAMEYIDKKYAALSVTMVNVGTSGGYDLLWKAAKTYRLSNNVGTPLITFGDNYILGWGAGSAQQFDVYVRPYLSLTKG